MAHRRRFSTESKREAVAMIESPGVSQIAAELGIGVHVLGRWRRELRQEPNQTFRGQGRPCDEEVGLLRRELARVTKERVFCEKRPRSARERRDKVSDDPAVPHCVSHPDAVPMCAGLAQRVLGLGDPAQVRERRRTSGYWSGSVCGMPTMTGSWEARASGKIYATPGNGVDATGWRA